MAFSQGFLLDGIPHHVFGSWQPQKKLAQRDAAASSLSFFVGEWGGHLSPMELPPMPSQAGLKLFRGSSEALEALASFCASYEPCDCEFSSLERRFGERLCRFRLEERLFMMVFNGFGIGPAIRGPLNHMSRGWSIERHSFAQYKAVVLPSGAVNRVSNQLSAPKMGPKSRFRACFGAK